MQSKSLKAGGAVDVGFALAFVVSCVYAFVLSLWAGIITWAGLGFGLSYETSFVAVLAFFGLEILLFFSDIPTPGILLTSLLVLPCAYIKDLELSNIPSSIRGQIIRIGTWPVVL